MIVRSTPDECQIGHWYWVQEAATAVQKRATIRLGLGQGYYRGKVKVRVWLRQQWFP